MRYKSFTKTALVAACALMLTTGITAAQGQDQTPGPGQDQGPGGGRHGMMGRGTSGTVTAVATDHYTITSESGETWTVIFSENTRIFRRGGRPHGDNSQTGPQADSPRTPPEQLKPTDVQTGDFITAAGQIDSAKKTVGATFVLVMDPEQVKAMHEMQANEGKTWVGGRIATITGTQITVTGQGGKTWAFTVDENTSFHRRQESITLADLHVGDMVRATGAVNAGSFVAASVVTMQMPGRRGSGDGSNPPPPQE